MVDKNEHWYERAVIYAIDTGKFYDGNGDGIGDFDGIIKRLDYLTALGVDCIWLAPFFDSPRRDNGYDVVNHLTVDSRYGSFEDFNRLIVEAHRRKIRICIDLPFHHTSKEHPWFQSSQRDPHSKYRGYYRWSKEIPLGVQPANAFPGEEDSVWSFDDVAGKYYYHTFYSFEPDLETDNPDVQDEMFQILDFWLLLGVDGIRIDAAGIMFFDTDQIDPTLRQKREAFMEKLRAFVEERNPEAVLIGEANVDPDIVPAYFKDDKRFHMLFNFLANGAQYLALVRKSAKPLAECLRHLPQPFGSSCWINFLRNFDELNLGRLSEQDRADVFDVLAPDPAMRLYGRGIRRRTASMLSGDMRKMHLLYSILFCLPGAVEILYGEEIGMGENLKLPDRETVRTPMQWSTAPHAGFSASGNGVLTTQILDEGPFRYEKVNVADQEADPHSLLAFTKNLIALRRMHEGAGSSSFKILDTADESVLALMHGADQPMLTLHNFNDREASADLSSLPGEPRDILADREYKSASGGSFALHPYGFRWIVFD